MFRASVDDMDEFAVLAQLPHLTQIKLVGVRIGDKELSYVSCMKGLQVLDLRETLVGDAGLRYLVGLRSLEVLQLEDVSPHLRPDDSRDVHYVSDEGMRCIGKLTSIEELRVSCELVSDAGVTELRSLSRLRSLNLSRTKITDSSLVEIAQFSHLQKLNVVYTNITPAGADAFRKAHPNVSVIFEGGTLESPDL
jgi:hypothetical protein